MQSEDAAYAVVGIKRHGQKASRSVSETERAALATRSSFPLAVEFPQSDFLANALAIQVHLLRRPVVVGEQRRAADELPHPADALEPLALREAPLWATHAMHT